MAVIRSAIVVLFCVLGLSGCLDGDALTVATAWTAGERSRFEDGVRRVSPGLKIEWVLLARGDDLRRVVRRRVPPDLILGGPASAYETLAAEGGFEADRDGKPAWSVIDRPAVAANPGGLEDPRRDPFSLDRAASVLNSGSWAEGYERLIRQVGTRGSVPLVNDPAARTEGVAVVRGARHSRTALAALPVGIGSPAPAARSESASLLADLLGATLVESHDELVTAWDALNAAGQPDRPRKWMTEAPPWPPASVAKILGREANAMPLLETLAAQIAPEADVRAWLLRSWLTPARPIDGARLVELAGAVDGRLAREPRFRSWLRAEWTAWARQRYRRVARRAGGWVPAELRAKS